MLNKKRMLEKVFWAISIAFIAIMVYALTHFNIEDVTLADGTIRDFNTGWVMTLEDGTVYEIDELPFSVPSNANETVILENTIPKEYAGLTLSFLSADKTVKVYIDDNQIYEFGLKDERTFGHTPGSMYNFIDIPDYFRYGKIRIEMVSPYKDYGSDISQMQIGARSVSILRLISNNATNFLLNILIFVCGFVFAFLAIVNHTSKKDSKGWEFMSEFCMIACIYGCIETKTLTIFYGNQTIYSIFVFLSVMILPVLLMLFFRRSWDERYAKFFNVSIIVCYINIIVQIILQVFNIVDFMNMSKVSHLLLFVSIIMCIVISVDRIRTNKSFDMVLEFVAFLLLGDGALVDLVRSLFVKSADFGKYSRIGMMAFSMLYAIVGVWKLSNGYAESVKKNAELLEREMRNVEEKNRELEAANAMAEEARSQALAANEAKSFFLANMSHEIRTPINALLGMDTMILKESNQAEIREYALDIQNAGQTLLALVNDILDFSKIESGKMEIIEANYDLSSVINDCYNMIAPQAKDKNIKLVLENDPTIPYMLYGDEVRVRQVVLNLLSNAVKYTHEGSVTVKVDYERVDRESLILKIVVSDTGIGIEAENIDKIFDSFKRIESKKNRTIQGTGLGLSITKRLVVAMEGKIWVESELGKGSVFNVEIPEKIVDDVPMGNLASKFEKQQETVQIYDGKFTAPNAKILIVDDVAMNLKVMVSLLKNTKITIDTVQSGRECLEYIGQNKYDIIFLDHMMPEMDGIEVFEKMKELDENKNLNKETPVIMLTANAIVGAEEEYLGLGFTDYLAKPVKEDKLEEMIMKYLPQRLVIKVIKDYSDIDTSRPILDNLTFLDTEKGLAYCGNDVEIYTEILKEYVNTTRDIDMQLYFDTRDWENYKIQVHALKSTSLTIGAIELSALAKGIELAARDEDYDYIREHHDGLISEYAQLLAKLRYILGCSE